MASLIFSTLPTELVFKIVRFMDASTIKTLSGDFRIAAISTQVAPCWSFEPLCNKILEQMEYRDKQFIYIEEFHKKLDKITATISTEEEELRDLCKAASMSRSAGEFFADDINQSHGKVELLERDKRNTKRAISNVYNFPLAQVEPEILKLWKSLDSIAVKSATYFKKFVKHKYEHQIRTRTVFQQFRYYGFIKTLEF